MNIGYFGNCWCASNDEHSHTTLLGKLLNANVVNSSVIEGSEGRILFKLKKTPNLDLALIFHDDDNTLFLPNATRDWWLTGGANFGTWFKSSWKKDFGGLFKSPQEFIDAITTYKKFFYHNDDHRNVYYGYMVLIDQYLLAKNIPCIHFFDSKKHHIPDWIEIKSGVVDYSFINTMNKMGGQNRKNRTPNYLTMIQNHTGAFIIADIIEKNNLINGVKCIAQS